MLDQGVINTVVFPLPVFIIVYTETQQKVLPFFQKYLPSTVFKLLLINVLSISGFTHLMN